jgi:Holliday junction resolvase RusA-like endonuclease
VRVSFTVRGYSLGKGRAKSRIVAPRGKKPFVSHYTPAKTRNFETSITFQAQAAMENIGAPFEGCVRVLIVSVHVVPASWSSAKRAKALAGILRPNVKPDFDNIGKLVCDAMNGIVYLDDKQVVDGRVVKWYGPIPMMEVTVTPLDEDALRREARGDEQELPL